MADESTDLIEGFDDDAGGKGGGKLFLIVMLVLGLGAGSYVGMSFGGEPVGAMLAKRVLNPSSGGGHGGDSHGGGGHGDDSGPSPIRVIENLVVNPARSGGSRFLLTSIAIEMLDPGLDAMVAEREVEMRSALILVLGAKTTEELTDIANRASVVAEIRETIVEILGPGVVADVFVPQFVIQ